MMKAFRSFKSPLMRQVNEPVRISSSRADMLLNSKNKFHQAPLTRLVALTGLQGDQGEDNLGVFPRAGGRGGKAAVATTEAVTTAAATTVAATTVASGR